MSSAFWRCSAGQLFGLRGPDLARGSLIEDLCRRRNVRRRIVVEPCFIHVGEDGASCLRGMLSHGSSSEMFEFYGVVMLIDSAYVTPSCGVDIFEVNI